MTFQARICSVDDLYSILRERISPYIHEPVLICIETTYSDGRNELHQALVLTPSKLVMEATDPRGGGAGYTRKLWEITRHSERQLSNGALRVTFETPSQQPDVSFDFPNPEHFTKLMAFGSIK